MIWPLISTLLGQKIKIKDKKIKMMKFQIGAKAQKKFIRKNTPMV